jgi:Ca2+-binding RTX toxin-like protein
MGRAALLALALLLTGAAPANAAATVTAPGGGAPVLLTDSPGNDFTLFDIVGHHPSGFEFRGHGLQAGPGCRQSRADEVVCEAAPLGTPVEFHLADGEDYLDAQEYRFPITVDAGPGDDQILSGKGPDRIDSGDGDDYVNALDLLFDSKLMGFFKKPVRDVVTCGGGDDAVAADVLDRVAQDCERRYMYGTTAANRLVGDGRPEKFFGRSGPDLIIGGGGADEINGEAGDDRIDSRDGEVDTIICGVGRDRVRADRVDVVVQEAPADRCERVVRE